MARLLMYLVIQLVPTASCVSGDNTFTLLHNNVHYASGIDPRAAGWNQQNY